MVCTESTISSRGRDRVDVAQHRRQVGLGRQVECRVQRAHPVGPQPHLRRGLLAGDDQARGPLPAAAQALAADSSRVDLPTPGSPASSTTAPGTSPPPSTRSSSATPLGRRGDLTADLGRSAGPGR